RDQVLAQSAAEALAQRLGPTIRVGNGDFVAGEPRDQPALEVIRDYDGADAERAIKAADGLALGNRERPQEKVSRAVRLWAQRGATEHEHRREDAFHCSPLGGFVPAISECGLRRRKSASSRMATAALSMLESVRARSTDSGARGEMTPRALSSVPRS